MLELARLGVATRPGYPRERLEAALARLARPERVLFFELEPLPSPPRDLRARARAASRSTVSCRRRSRPRSRGSACTGRLRPSDGGYTARVAERTTTDLSSLEQARRIAALAQEKLATDVVILDMRPVCVYTDFFVVATGRNPRQTKAIYDEVHATLKQEHGCCRARSTASARRPGSSPTTSTSSCTSSRPRRAASTGSRISGATCPRSSVEAAAG